MASVTNKTRKPLSVPLPGGKTLHLGPGRTGQIAPKAAEHPPVKMLVESGEIEITDDGRQTTGGFGGAKMGPSSGQAHGPGGVSRRSGDR
jgi:hypothetical protein